MAFGLSPKYVQDIQFMSLSSEQFLVIAIETAKKLNWNIGYTSENGFIAFTKFSMSSWSEEIKLTINDDYATIKSECTGSQMVDWGKNRENITKFISTFTELKDTLTLEELAQKQAELIPGLVSKEDDLLSQPPSSTKEKLTGFFSIFKPSKGYFITPIIIDLNILVFVLMVLSGVNALLPDSDSLMLWGANLRPVTLSGEWWRLVTNCFLHIGIIHLIMNMYALLYIGVLLEPHLGKTRFAAAYLLTGIAASITSLWWHDQTISAGASGAIFGMYGVFLAMLTTNLIDKATRKALITSIAIFVGYNLINGMKGGIDNAAHIGGLMSGLVIGYGYYPSLKKKENNDFKHITIGLLAFIVIFSTYLIYIHFPIDQSKKYISKSELSKYDLDKYDLKIKEFVASESMALEVYGMPENTPKDKILAEIKNRGIYYWNDNIKIVKELEELNIPPILHERNKTLFRYCNLRIKSFELMYKKIEEGTDIYSPQIEVTNGEIEKIIKELSGK